MISIRKSFLCFILFQKPFPYNSYEETQPFWYIISNSSCSVAIYDDFISLDKSQTVNSWIWIL